MRLIPSEVVVNVHLTEACNYRCCFCFGKWSDSPRSDELFADVERGVSAIRALVRVFWPVVGVDGIVRVTFAGGEPALCRWIGEFAAAAKSEGAQTGFTSNGEMLTRFDPAWLGEHFDYAGVSIDSASDRTNCAIGRGPAGRRPQDLELLLTRIEAFQSEQGKPVKINTVVSSFNRHEDLGPLIRRIRPVRWTLLQVLPVYGGVGVISKPEFDSFVERHREFADVLSVEDNASMTGTYVMVDPFGRFFWRSSVEQFGYEYSAAISDVGVTAALGEVPLSWSKYVTRTAPRPLDVSLPRRMTR